MISRLKNNKRLVSLYQRLIGYKAGNKQWCRVVMDRSVEELIAKQPIAKLRVLEISGSKWKDFGFLTYRSVEYPNFDLCAQVLDERFDLIIAEQVFEHLLWPYRAGTNVYRMLESGGHFLITTPFMIKVHNFPIDCSRWTPLGIKYLLAECGFQLDKIVSDSWGNAKCVVANFHEWMPYNPKKHSLENEPNFPMVVWALAEK